MLKKLIRLNINDLWLCLGVVAFFFLATQVITGAVLLLAEGVHSVPLVSGVALPIMAGIMTLVVSISHTSVSFVQALRFGQTRRRALGMMLSMALFESACATALAAALAWVERTFFPALWLSLSGLGKMVWGGIPPVPEPSIWQGSDQEWAALEGARRVALELADHGPSQEEVDRVREQAKANLLMGSESVQARMSHLGSSALLYGRVRETEELLELYDAVTREQLRDLAGALFRMEAASLSAVGRVGASADYAAWLGR